MIPADTYADGDDEIIGDFGVLGLWQWDKGWSWMTGSDPEYMILADVDGDGEKEVVADFVTLGYG